MAYAPVACRSITPHKEVELQRPSCDGRPGLRRSLRTGESPSLVTAPANKPARPLAFVEAARPLRSMGPWTRVPRLINRTRPRQRGCRRAYAAPPPLSSKCELASSQSAWSILFPSAGDPPAFPPPTVSYGMVPRPSLTPGRSVCRAFGWMGVGEDVRSAVSMRVQRSSRG